MKGDILTALLVTGTALCAASQVALGANITISDRVSSGTGWYGNHEDQEVEPNCITGQAWDLESFELTGTTLTLTGGWNFQNGYDRNASGDIFIDVNGDAVFGQDVYGGSGDGNRSQLNSSYDYDYVIHFNDRSGTTIGGGGYQVIRLAPDTVVNVTSGYYRQNDESSPWVYASGGEQVGSGSAGFDDFVDSQGVHFTMAVDVGFLGDVSDALFKFTMQCGNDNLIGQGTVSVPDGGVTAILLGMGLIGMAAIRRRLRN